MKLAGGGKKIRDYKVNDTYVHGVGDLVLKAVVNCISRSIRDYDTCARYGGDEFVVLLPNDLPGEGAGIEKIGLRMLENIVCVFILKSNFTLPIITTEATPCLNG